MAMSDYMQEIRSKVGHALLLILLTINCSQQKPTISRQTINRSYLNLDQTQKTIMVLPVTDVNFETDKLFVGATQHRFDYVLDSLNHILSLKTSSIFDNCLTMYNTDIHDSLSDFRNTDIYNFYATDDELVPYFGIIKPSIIQKAYPQVDIIVCINHIYFRVWHNSQAVSAMGPADMGFQTRGESYISAIMKYAIWDYHLRAPLKIAFSRHIENQSPTLLKSGYPPNPEFLEVPLNKYYSHGLINREFQVTEKDTTGLPLVL